MERILDCFRLSKGDNGGSSAFKGDGPPPKTINIFLGFFFMVNFVLGTGFLGIPFGFVHGGILSGIVTLLVIASIAWNCALWEVESMARAQALCDYRTKGTILGDQPFYISVFRKFEPSELCEVFIGRWMKIVFLIILTVYSFFATLSYSTVAGSAWSVNLPLNFGPFNQCTDGDFFNNIRPTGDGCLHSYWFCLLLFAVLVVPVTLLDLKEQAIIQFGLGVLRFFTLGAIIIYCFVHLVQGGMADCDEGVPAHEPNYTNIDVLNMTDLVNATDISTIRELFVKFEFSGWVVSVPVFVYAFILHQGIPSLTHPIREKKWLRGYFNILFAVITVFYVLLGLIVAMWFRDCTNETCTLNWGPLKDWGNPTELRVLSYYIILFPSIDVCSVFPLLIHTIVNNLYTVIFGRDTSQSRGWKHRLIQIGMKFVAALLPIAIAMAVSNLVYVLKYAGLLGFFISLFFPMLWQLMSSWACFKEGVVPEAEVGSPDRLPNQIQEEKAPLLGGTQSAATTGSRVYQFFFTYKEMYLYKTPYSTPLSHPLCVIFFLVLAIVCFILTVISLFM